MAGIESLLNQYSSPYTSSTSAASNPFGIDTSGMRITKQQAQAMVDEYKNGSSSVKTLKKDTANFLDQYIAGTKRLDQAANNVRLDKLDKLLHDKDGNVTDETVANTIKAVQSMVDEYNSNVKLLNDNADRGPGVSKQLARMVRDPAPKEGMEMVGLSMNKDGTLALDTEKMTEALKTTDKNQLDLYKDILGGWNGIADSVHKNAQSGQQISARDLVSNDLANIQSRQATNPFKEMLQSTKGNAFMLNNMAVAGMMMNMLV